MKSWSWFFFARTKNDEVEGETIRKAPSALKSKKPSRLMAGAPEKVQDYVRGRGGERVGFRKLVQG